jgi:hypothetical protein
MLVGLANARPLHTFYERNTGSKFQFHKVALPPLSTAWHLHLRRSWTPFCQNSSSSSIWASDAGAHPEISRVSPTCARVSQFSVDQLADTVAERVCAYIEQRMLRQEPG